MSAYQKIKFVIHTHFTATDVIERFACFHNSPTLIARSTVNQPIRELVLEVVTLASPVTLDVRRVPELL